MWFKSRWELTRSYRGCGPVGVPGVLPPEDLCSPPPPIMPPQHLHEEPGENSDYKPRGATAAGEGRDKGATGLIPQERAGSCNTTEALL